MKAIFGSLMALGALTFLQNGADAAPMPHETDLDHLVQSAMEWDRPLADDHVQLAGHCAPRHYHGHHYRGGGYPAYRSYYRGGIGYGGYRGVGGVGPGWGGYGRGWGGYGPYGGRGLGLYIGF